MRLKIDTFCTERFLDFAEKILFSQGLWTSRIRYISVFSLRKQKKKGFRTCFSLSQVHKPDNNQFSLIRSDKVSFELHQMFQISFFETHILLLPTNPFQSMNILEILFGKICSWKWLIHFSEKIEHCSVQILNKTFFRFARRKNQKRLRLAQSFILR